MNLKKEAGVMVHSCQSRTWEFKSGGSRVHAHPQLTVKYKPAWYICIIRKIKQQQKNWKIVVAKNVTFGIEFYVMWPNIYIGSLPLYKTGVAAFSFNPSTLRWVGVPEVQCHPQLHRKFQASIESMEICLKIK